MSKWEQEEHNRGQEEGSKNDAGGHLFHELFWRHFESDEFNSGYDNGRNNPSDEDGDGDSPESSGNSGEESGGCFLTTACVRAAGLPDDCDELTTLRRFRDDVLLANPTFQAMVAEYYQLAPGIVTHVNERPDAQQAWTDALVSIRDVVGLIQSERHSEAISAYRRLADALGNGVVATQTVEGKCAALHSA